MSRSSLGQRGDSRCAPGKGTSKAVPDFTGELGEKQSKAKQAGAQLFYKAQASISALVLLNEAEGDFQRMKKPLTSP